MSDPRYRYAHQQERKRWVPIVAAGQAMCAEPVCVMPSRQIEPDSKWHLCHDPSGLLVIGPGHETCNVTEAATRMHRDRRPPLPAWTL